MTAERAESPGWPHDAMEISPMPLICWTEEPIVQ